MSSRSLALLSVAILLVAGVSFFAESAEASSKTVENKRVIITNIYGSEFVSLGSLDESEHRNSGIYFFIEGSERHEIFKKYLDGSIKFIPNDDWSIIRQGSDVHAYFFDSNVYQEWHTLVTFEDDQGEIRFKSVQFRIERPIDSLNYFFLADSTAHIQWMNMESVAVSAFFNDAEIKGKEMRIPIEKNGAYSLKFVASSNAETEIATTVSYTVEGYDDSSSMAVGTVFWVIFLLSLAVVVLLRRGPRWSGKGGLE